MKTLSDALVRAGGREGRKAQESQTVSIRYVGGDLSRNARDRRIPVPGQLVVRLSPSPLRG